MKNPTLWGRTYLHSPYYGVPPPGQYRGTEAPLFKSLKILNIFELNAYLTAVFMYSHHQDKLPAILDNLFKSNKVHIPYNTRSAANMHIEFRKTNHGKYSIGFNGAIIWSAFPQKKET